MWPPRRTTVAGSGSQFPLLMERNFLFLFPSPSRDFADLAASIRAIFFSRSGLLVASYVQGELS
jgi:hypothetical protein